MKSKSKIIPLSVPNFVGNERKYLKNCIDTTFVSSVGKYVNKFEHDFVEYTGVKHAVATVDGTAAMHICLKLNCEGPTTTGRASAAGSNTF